MARLMEVPYRVLAGRGVAAADMAARLALPEFDPARAFFQALLTGARRSRRWEVGRGQVLQVFTRLRHGVLRWMLARIASANLRPPHYKSGDAGGRFSGSLRSCPHSAPRWPRLSAPPRRSVAGPRA